MIDKLITQGWPADKNIFDHASYELLKWNADHKEEYMNANIVNPGTMGLVSSGFKARNFGEMEKQMQDVKVDRNQLLKQSPSKRAADVLKQTADKYPELDE